MAGAAGVAALSLISSNSVPKPRILSVRALYVLSPLHLPVSIAWFVFAPQHLVLLY